jgi:Divergent InlB B-repeat domain
MAATRTRLHVLIACLALALPLAVSAGARAASAPSTPVNLTSTQVAQALFVAGDVARLSQVPSGTESLVEEKILQQLYVANPNLPVSQAISDIQGLEATLSGSSPAISPATLTVMAGNQRILAILRALTDSGPAQDVANAIAQVDNQALTQASDSDYLHGNWFDASADSLDTIGFQGFSPANALAATASLAQANKLFGQARDALWQTASHESVFDGTQMLLKENPDLENSAVQQLVGMLASDGSLQTTVGQLETLVGGGLAKIDDQQCALAGGSTGGSPSDCTSGAVHDAQMVSAACQAGASTGCTDAKNQDQSDTNAELATIAAQQAATTAGADALYQADQSLGQSELAEAQAAAQLADQEQQYLAWQSFQGTFKAGTDLVSLAVTLSVSEVDPVAAVTGLLNVIGDALGFSFSGPDPNTLILQGIQNLSQQLSDFESYTQTAFSAVSLQLAGISSQIAADSLKLSTQLAQVQGTLNVLSGDLSTLQTSVDHLQNEIQSLFASANWDSLRSQIDQYLGYQHQNGVALPQTQFATAAGQLLSDAQNTAVSHTEVSPPAPFDALDANSLVTGSDPLTLDTNINYFNLFGSGVTDSPTTVSWPGALSTTCAAGADVAAGICLPDPDYWATAARAFGQLLIENPTYVTQDRLQELQALNQEGQTIVSALGQLSSNDAGADADGVNNAGNLINGTGNKRLDAALSYYAYWAGVRRRQTTIAPPLPIAVENAENTILANTNTPGLVSGSAYGSAPIPYAGVFPWLGSDQPPDLNNIAKISSLSNVPVCASEDMLGNNFNYATQDLLPAGAAITGEELGFLSTPLLNAVRLGQGSLSACYTARFIAPETNTGGPLVLSLFVYYTGGAYNDQLVGEIDATGQANFCQGFLGDQFTEGVEAVGDGCQNATIVSLLQGTVTSGQAQDTEPSGLDQYATGQFNQALGTLQRTVLAHLINGTHVTQGTNPDYDDVEAAADRAAGSSAVLNGYISLGLPQALASDDTLNGLINGTGSDPFTTPDLNGCNFPGVVAGGTLEAEVINYLQAASASVANGTLANRDPGTCLSLLVQDRVAALSGALAPHIIPTATGASAPVSAGARLSLVARAEQSEPAATASTVFAEENPLIAPTLDRLDDTQAALSEEMANGTRLSVEIDGTGQGTVTGSGVNCPGTCSASETPQSTVTLTAMPAPGSSFTGWSGACSGTGTCTVALPYDQNVIATFGPGGPGATTTTTAASTSTSTTVNPLTAKCTLKVTSNKVLLKVPKGKPKTGAPAPKPGTVSLIVKCNQAGRVKLTGRLTQLIGAKRGRGKQKPKTYKLGRVSGSVKAGRVLTLTVKLPAAAVGALGTGAKESATFAVALTGASGSARATTKVAALKGTR